jgi:hypothetical protein
MIIGALSIVYAVYILRDVDTLDILNELENSSSG